MTLLTEPAIICPLLPFLSVGDIYRLHRAIGKGNFLPPDTIHEVAARMSLKMRQCYTLNSLSRRMESGRCVECGVRCRSKPSVCGTCSAFPNSFIAMVTRADIRLMIGQKGPWRRRHPRLVQLWSHGIVKRGRLGAYYYWRKEVEDIIS
jgi:hypothetical protein